MPMVKIWRRRARRFRDDTPSEPLPTIYEEEKNHSWAVSRLLKLIRRAVATDKNDGSHFKKPAIGLVLVLLVLVRMTASQFTRQKAISEDNDLLEASIRSNDPMEGPCNTSNYKEYTNTTPADTAVVCAIVSNEEYYLDEWIDYNLGIGFSHIYVYDNTDNFEMESKPSDEYTSWLERRTDRLGGRVSLHHYPGPNAQWTAYRDCANRVLKDGHRWVFFTDVDEFLVLKKHDNVVSFMLEHDVLGTAVSVNWQVQSWSERVQYDPRPVTLRFTGIQPGSAPNTHVKTISNVDVIDLEAELHPHYAKLTCGRFAVDTTGAIVGKPEPALNVRNPRDVALVYHYNTKSWKEYVDKRLRGRADMEPGAHLDAHLKKLVEAARRGDDLKNSTGADNSAWDIMKGHNPRYRFFEDGYGNATVGMGHRSGNVSIGICTYAAGQEAYIDEWLDYHVALGFGGIHVYDGTTDHWMRQWGEERRKAYGTRLTLAHFPHAANVTFAEERARTYAGCARAHGNEHDALVFMEVNDFFVFPEDVGVERLVPLVNNRSGACADQFERAVFGHNGQFLHDPLPVTQRFFRRIEGIPTSSILLLRTKWIIESTTSMEKFGGIDNTTTWPFLERDLLHYFRSGQFHPESACAVREIESAADDVSVHHYLRSEKECRKQGGNYPTLCNVRGTVVDRLAWERVQRWVPWYSNFNGLI